MKFPEKKEDSEANAKAKRAGGDRPALSSPSKGKRQKKRPKGVATGAERLGGHGPDRMLRIHSHGHSQVARGSWGTRPLCLGQESWKSCLRLGGSPSARAAAASASARWGPGGPSGQSPGSGSIRAHPRVWGPKACVLGPLPLDGHSDEATLCQRQGTREPRRSLGNHRPSFRNQEGDTRAATEASPRSQDTHVLASSSAATTCSPPPNRPGPPARQETSPAG